MTFFWLLVTLGAAPAAVADDNTLQMSRNSFIDAFVTDTGRAVLAIHPSPAPESPHTTLVSWNGAVARTLEIDLDVKALRELTGDRLMVRGFKRADGPEPDQIRWPWPLAYGFRVYRVTESGFRLEEEFDLEPEWVEPGWVEVSPDLRLWVGMTDLYPPYEDRVPPSALGRRFAFGSVKSGRLLRTMDVELFAAAPLEDDVVAFRILGSEGPIVLASYSTSLFLLRFFDEGVDTVPVDHLRAAVEPSGGDLRVIWQDDENILWALVSNEWLAYDLWNLAYASSVPREPFLRRKAAAGRPHAARGFVEVQERTDGAFRVRHVWQSPQFPDWQEEHLSDWQVGKAPRSPIVSANGRHLLIVDVSRSEERVDSTMARRIGLTRAPSRLPPEAARQRKSRRKDRDRLTTPTDAPVIPSRRQPSSRSTPGQGWPRLSYGAPVPDEPANRRRPSGRVTSRPFARGAPSIAW